jgi:hypothetical protein
MIELKAKKSSTKRPIKKLKIKKKIEMKNKTL